VTWEDVAASQAYVFRTFVCRPLVTVCRYLLFYIKRPADVVSDGRAMNPSEIITIVVVVFSTHTQPWTIHAVVFILPRYCAIVLRLRRRLLLQRWSALYSYNRAGAAVVAAAAAILTFRFSRSKPGAMEVAGHEYLLEAAGVEAQTPPGRGAAVALKWIQFRWAPNFLTNASSVFASVCVYDCHVVDKKTRMLQRNERNRRKRVHAHRHNKYNQRDAAQAEIF
jgi:hypothetical protein